MFTSHNIIIIYNSLESRVCILNVSFVCAYIKTNMKMIMRCLFRTSAYYHTAREKQRESLSRLVYAQIMYKILAVHLYIVKQHVT